MKSRVIIVFLGLLLFWSALLVRGFFIQVLPNEKLSKLKTRQFETVIDLEPRRGDILDREGRELAASLAVYSLFADPKIIDNPKQVARILSKKIGHTPQSLYQKIKNRDRRFVWLQRKLEQREKEEIEKLKIKGLGFVEETKRVYPNDSVLSHAIGFVGYEGDGLEGLELKYQSELKGEGKKLSFSRDALGRPLLVNGQIFTERPGGATLRLTVDADIQYHLENELAKVVTDFEAEAAVGVVLEAKTSEVIAMATTPTFDANKGLKLPPQIKRNRAITDVFEPGSTLKTFTIAAAIREGILQPNSVINCENGRMKVGNRWIREADSKHAWGDLTVSQILEKSSNVGTTKIAFQLGQEKLFKNLREFGFGVKTGIDLPGETRGLMSPLPWRPHHFSNISFGHGIAVSPIQIANAYAAIANGGWLKTPRVVKSIYNRDEAKDETPETPEAKQILTESQAFVMRMMLTNATGDFGTGGKARVPGFLVAGKTGTAQKVNPDGRGYLKGSYISSFAGFIPANEPEFVIYIAVDGPKKAYYGSDVAAPVFSRVAQMALRKRGITPTVLNEKDVIRQTHIERRARQKEAIQELADATSESKTLPDWKGLSVREVLKQSDLLGVKIKFHGRGQVSGTIPAAGAPIPTEDIVSVYLTR